MPRVTFPESNVGIYVFSGHTTGSPPQYEFDVQRWRDPMANKELRALDGTHAAVRAYVARDVKTSALVNACESLVYDIIVQQKQLYLSLGFRDHHGLWIARALGEIVADVLSEKGYKVYVLDRTTC